MDGLNEAINTEIENRDIAVATAVSAMEAAISAEAEARDTADATKQDIISDLDEIRSGAALGATAIQEHQDISGKADKAELASVATSGNYDDLDNKPSIPQVSLEDDVLVINV